MPVYEYESAEHGVRVDLPFPVDDRPDEIVLRRRTVPSRVTIGTGAKAPTMSDVLRGGYKKLESEGKLDMRRSGGLTVEDVKRAMED